MIFAMPSQTLDLFDDTDPTTEVRNYQAAFDAWLTHQRTSVARKLTLPSSIKAYTVLWQAFAEWCLGQSPVVALDTLTEADLNAFINSRLSATSASSSCRSWLIAFSESLLLPEHDTKGYPILKGWTRPRPTRE